MNDARPQRTGIRLGASETVVLEGDVTFESVPRLYREMERLLPQTGPVRRVDLAEVGQVDSAGLALLLEWQSRQRARGAELRMSGAPDNLLRLARLCEAVDLLGLSARGSSV